MTAEHTYQPELDGLRALAVIGVLLCHLEVSWLPGGFVGVDIFFVLSGYLITRLISTEIIETGGFRFGNFYLRRLRRLYPALISTVVLAWIGSFLLLSPAQMKGFGQSAIAAIFSFSNILFYSQADYFDALATTKPLLHTWSLSVEEQFYLLWPLTLLIASRLRGRLGMILALAVICVSSFALAQYWLAADATAAFYMLPARAVELGLGALIVFRPAIRSRWLLNTATVVGVVAMIVPMLVYSEETPFPGLAAMLPCVGAALFIAGARSQATAPFRLAPVAWIGRISYSLYLVHWPVIVLWRAYTYQPIETGDALLLAACSVVLAWLQYELIEQRFRRPVPGRNRRVVVALALSAVLVSGTSATAGFGNGWAWRVPKERITSTKAVFDSKECRQRVPELDPALVTCQTFRGKDKDLFVWGDSHAIHLAPGLWKSFPDYNIYVLHLSACPPQSGFGGYVRQYATKAERDACIKRNKDALTFFTAGPPRNVLISSAKRGKPEAMAEITNDIVAQLQSAGNKVVVMGDFMEPGIDLVDCVGAPAYLVSSERIRERCVADQADVVHGLAYNDVMQRLIPAFVTTNDVQCPDGVCQYFDSGRLLYRDYHHLSGIGSRLFMSRMRPLLPFD